MAWLILFTKFCWPLGCPVVSLLPTACLDPILDDIGIATDCADKSVSINMEDTIVAGVVVVYTAEDGKKIFRDKRRRRIGTGVSHEWCLLLSLIHI